MSPLKSGQSVANQWQTVNDIGGRQTFRGHESIDSRGRLASSARDQRLDAAGKVQHPFLIYSFPVAWRQSPSPTTDWLKFRVSLGFFNNVAVTGCDRTNAAPGSTYYVPGGADAQTIPSESGADFTGTEYLLPSGQAQIYFWIDATSASAPAVKWGYTGSTTVGIGGTPTSQGWTAFPTPDATHIPIGWVDTQTDAVTNWAHIQQLLRQDNPAAGSAATVAPYTFVADGGTYWACTDSSGNPCNLGKPYKLRTSISSEVIAGVTYSYTYAVVNGLYQRTVSYSGITEVDELVPPILVGDTIYGLSAPSLPLGAEPLAVATATVLSGGTGYVSGDVGKVLTVAGGTSSVAATLTIASVSGGAVATVTVSNGGAYTVNPTLTGNAATAGSPAPSGSGATFNLTMSTAVLDLNVDARAWSEM